VCELFFKYRYGKTILLDSKHECILDFTTNQGN